VVEVAAVSTNFISMSDPDTVAPALAFETQHSTSPFPRSSEDFAMGSEPGQPQSFGVRLAVDQQQVRLDVAFAIASPFAAQFMIAASWRQRLIVCKSRQNRREIGIQRGNIAYVESDSRTVETQIARWLQTSGRITADELLGLENVSRQMDRSVLETLVAKRFRTQHQLQPEFRFR